MKVDDYYKNKEKVLIAFQRLKEHFIEKNARCKIGRMMTVKDMTIKVEKIEVSDNIQDHQQNFVALRYFGKKIKKDGKLGGSSGWIYEIVKQTL